MPSHRQTIRKFTIRNLFELTTACAILLALAHWMGPNLSFAMFAIAYAFAPSIGMVIAAVFSDYSDSVRWSVVALTLATFAFVMMIAAGILYGPEAMVFVLYGTAMEWPGQIGVLLCLRLIWRAGVDSSKVTKPS